MNISLRSPKSFRALQLVERKVLLSILNSRKVFERDLPWSDSKICDTKTLRFLRLTCIVYDQNFYRGRGGEWGGKGEGVTVEDA